MTRGMCGHVFLMKQPDNNRLPQGAAWEGRNLTLVFLYIAGDVSRTWVVVFTASKVCGGNVALKIILSSWSAATITIHSLGLSFMKRKVTFSRPIRAAPKQHNTCSISILKTYPINTFFFMGHYEITNFGVRILSHISTECIFS